MAKILMQSVVSQIQKERTRLEDELHRVTAALTAFGKACVREACCNSKKANDFGCRTEENSSRSAETMGKDPSDPSRQGTQDSRAEVKSGSFAERSLIL
jgi:hypothetical protein